MMKLKRKSEAEVRREFTRKRIIPLFCKYAIPSAVCLLFLGIQVIIDGVLVGYYIGADALAGINITMPLYSFVTSLTVVVGIGCQTIMSISSGEKNFQKASDALRTAFIFLIVTTTIIAILVLGFSSQVVALLGADQSLFEYSIGYITTIALFFPILSMLQLGDCLLKSQGNPYKGLAILGSATLLNIIFDYLFIAHWGLGVKGAALATGLSFSIGAMFAVPNMFRHDSTISVLKGRFRGSLLGNMLYNGSSEGMAELSAGIEVFLFNRAMMYYVGAMGVAAFTSISYLLYIGITLFVGMSNGIIPVLSYNYGASSMKRVLKLLRTSMVVNLSVGVVIFLFILLGGDKIITLFFQNSGNVDLVNLAVTGSKICAWAFLFNGFNIAVSSFFTSMEDAKLSVIISVMRGFGFIGVGILVLPHFFGLTGIWLAIPVAELLTFLFAIVLLRKKINIDRLTRKVKYRNN